MLRPHAIRIYMKYVYIWNTQGRNTHIYIIYALYIYETRIYMKYVYIKYVYIWNIQGRRTHIYVIYIYTTSATHATSATHVHHLLNLQYIYIYICESSRQKHSYTHTHTHTHIIYILHTYYIHWGNCLWLIFPEFPVWQKRCSQKASILLIIYYS